MESYTFPVILYAIMLVCCIILIIQNRIAAAKDKESKFEKLDVRVWITIGAIVIYALLWQVIGFMASTFLFIPYHCLLW